jgi:hypothetical protein
VGGRGGARSYESLGGRPLSHSFVKGMCCLPNSWWHTRSTAQRCSFRAVRRGALVPLSEELAALILVVPVSNHALLHAEGIRLAPRDGTRVLPVVVRECAGHLCVWRRHRHLLRRRHCFPLDRSHVGVMVAMGVIKVLGCGGDSV